MQHNLCRSAEDYIYQFDISHVTPLSFVGDLVDRYMFKDLNQSVWFSIIFRFVRAICCG